MKQINTDSMKLNKTQRKSGIELLRIFALLAVIMIHYCDKALPLIDNSLNLNVMLLLRSISSCAVDVFILISGYFMVKSNKRILGKPVNILAQVIYRNLIIYGLLILLGLKVFEIKYLAFRIVPASYYPVLFVVLYLISPYINSILSSLSSKALRTFIIIVFLLFSIWPSLVDFSQELFDYQWFGLSTVGAWGNQQGFNIVNFVLLYCVGAWLRLDEISISTRKKNIVWLIGAIILIFIWSIVCTHLSKQGMRSSWVYHNPLVIIYSVLLFLLFKRLHFTNRFVNYLANSVLLCFLIHSGVIANIDIGISKVCNESALLMISHYLAFSVVMVVVSCIAYELFDLITKRFFSKLNNKEVPYNF